VTDVELQIFYEDLVSQLRAQGALCAITSGLACVHFDIAETTKDCDLLCHPTAFRQLLDLLEATQVEGQACRYRGNLSPPLDDRWHRGGWTSHFQWGEGVEAVTLDVFGRALRGTEPWENELSGLYVSPAIVAEMKRTNRDKDWPFITLLGEWLIETGDARGWLHLFEADALRRLLPRHPCPAGIIARRPALRLALDRDARVEAALFAERQFWVQLDRLRVRVYERALRPYVVAVRRAQIAAGTPLHGQHEIRLRCAAETLRPSPLVEYGLERYVEEARRATAELVQPELLQWLPDVSPHFNYLKT